MQIAIVAVGKAGRVFAEAAAEYERRARRYWKIEVHEVKEGKGRSESAVRAAEAERLAAALPQGYRAVALTREGEAWSSPKLAEWLSELALHSVPGAAFVIGGAAGLEDDFVRRADARLSLSAMTMPHELARVVLLEQLYRAGTIVRGEPYHRGPSR